MEIKEAEKFNQNREAFKKTFNILKKQGKFRDYKDYEDYEKQKYGKSFEPSTQKEIEL